MLDRSAPSPAPVAPANGHSLLGSLDGARILLVRFSGLGDVVLTLPAVRALRRAYPNAHLAWLVADSCRAIPEMCPDVDEVVPIRLTSVTDRAATFGRRLGAIGRYAQEWVRLAHRFQDAPYDVVIELQNLFKCAFFGALNRRAVRVGFRGEGEPTYVLLHHAPVRKDTHAHAVGSYVRLAEACGGVGLPVEFPLAIPAAATERAGVAMGEAGIRADDRLVLLSPFGRRASKLWPRDRFAALARWIGDATGARCVCAPAPTDLAAAREIAAGSGGRLTVLPGLGLPEVCALLRRATAYVGIDGGPMHVAGALGTPVFAIYGATNRRWIGPWGEVAGPYPGTSLPRAVVVQGDAPEDPSTRSARRRAWSDRSAIEAVTLDQALAALDGGYGALLRGTVARPGADGAGEGR